MKEPNHHSELSSPAPGTQGETLLNAQTTPPCPPDHVWDELCGGVLPEAQAATYLQHAAQCSECSCALHESTELFAIESSPGEDAFLATLQTSIPATQAALARRLRNEASGLKLQTPAPLPATRSWVFWLPLATAAALLLSFGVWKLKSARDPSDTVLLAQAYTRHRISELRIPDAASVELASPTRSAEEPRRASSELLRVKLRVEEQFEKNPNDAGVRQKLGEIAIVEHDGQTALKNFEIAQILSPHLARIEFDLGSAYFELAETEKQPLAYARAIDFFSQSLQVPSPDRPVALFDRALCWERESVIPNAIQDFEAALAAEKDPGWRREIQRHLDQLHRARSQSDQDHSTSQLLTPGSVLALRQNADGDYESDLDPALKNWLLNRQTEPDANQALLHLAALGAEHQDRWLDDMLTAEPSPDEDKAETALVASLLASSSGKTGNAMTLAEQAEVSFSRAKNRAGYLRASLERIYALQRSADAAACINAAGELLRSRDLDRYAWLRLSTHLEISSCYALQGRNAEALREAQLTLQGGERAHLPLLTLRAASFSAADEYVAGQFSSAWFDAAAFLQRSNQLPGTAMRRYQLLATMQSVARQLGLRWTEEGVSAAAAESALRAGNAQVSAYALEDLALSRLGIGAAQSAEKSFREADAELAKLGTGSDVALYRADWRSDRAELMERQQGSGAALAAIETDQPQFEKLGAVHARIRFYTEYADLLRKQKRPEDSLAKAWEAVAGSGAVLLGTRSGRDEQAREQQISLAYQVLIADLVDLGKPEDALHAWEWLRAAPYRSDSRVLNAASLHTIAWRVSSEATGDRKPLTLVFARMPDRYLAWSISGNDEHSIHLRSLPLDPRQIDAQVNAFARVCAEPTSSRADLVLLGSRLYQELLAPFAADLDAAGLVQLDLDDSLMQLPFAALQSQERFFGVDHPLVYLLHGRAAVSKASSDASLAQPSGLIAHLLLVRGEPLVQMDTIPDEYDESLDVQKRFPAAHLIRANLVSETLGACLAGSNLLSTTLRDAEMMHYSGHAIADPAEPDARLCSGPNTFALTVGSLPRCRLAVLAACRTLHKRETAPDDVPALTNTLLSAGANQVLATQWDVDSRTTRRLMLSFYEGIAQGQSFSGALQEAMRRLKLNSDSDHPFFWAPFQLVVRSAIPG